MRGPGRPETEHPLQNLEGVPLWDRRGSSQKDHTTSRRVLHEVSCLFLQNPVQW